MLRSYGMDENGNMTKGLFVPSKFQLLFICVLCLFTSAAQAYNKRLKCEWHPVIAVGGGYMASNQVGKSKTFPIVNPTTDSFYQYTASHSTRTSQVGDVFVGTELRFGCYPWKFQLGVGYDQAAPFKAKGTTLIQGADQVSEDILNYQYDVLLHQLLLEGKMFGFLNSIFHPYLFAGVGASFNSASSFQSTVPVFLTFTRTYKSQTQTNFSYALGFGIDFDLDCVLRVGIGYRYNSFGIVSLGDATIDTTSVPGTLSQSNLYTNEVLAQITYVFE